MQDAKSTPELSITKLARIEEDDRSDSTRNAALCALIVAVCVLIIYPVADMPYGDDFSYTKTALDFERTGRILYNGWSTAMLGWLIPWGALFIRLFGFSFTVVRLSMLPIAMMTVYLLHQVLRRFGINRGNAVLGTLTIALSPLFLGMTSSYMTDLPSLAVIVLCMYMCQRAVATQSDGTALLWLCSAAVLNVAGGTVRQIAWLGALVMVPSTAWLLRKRRGMKIAGITLWLSSLISVIVCLHWFNRQPYVLPEPILREQIRIRSIVHLAAELLKTFLCLLLVILPCLIAWLKTAPLLSFKAKRWLAVAIAICASLSIVLYRSGRLDSWVEPWLLPLLASQAIGQLNLWMKLGISLLVITTALIFLGQIASRKQDRLIDFNGQCSSWNELAWLLGPFSLAYLLMLMPRGMFSIIQDRYLLGIIPTAIIFELKLYQKKVTDRLPIISLITLAIFAAYAIGDAHDTFSGSRALVKTIAILQDSGVARTSIRAWDGWGLEGWAQIEEGGYINESRIVVPSGAYNPNTLDLKLPEQCTFWFASFTPKIMPKYFIVSQPKSCFAGTQFTPVHYRAWLPPFHRAFYVQQLPINSK